MANWTYSVGNLLTRAPAAPVASGGSLEDPLYPLADLGSGHPDEPSRWRRNDAGDYRAELDLNQLASSSDRADAPTGWADLTNFLEGQAGLPVDPPDYGDYGGRVGVLRAFRPVYQDVTVMPGEDGRITVMGGDQIDGLWVYDGGPRQAADELLALGNTGVSSSPDSDPSYSSQQEDKPIQFHNRTSFQKGMTH